MPPDRRPLSADEWRRIGAVLDALHGVDVRADAAAVVEACRAEGVDPCDVEPFLAAERDAEGLPDRLDPAMFGEVLRSHAAVAPAVGTQLHAGACVGAYEVLSLLGTGGMGEVYKARDSRLGRTVALKILRNEIASGPEGRQHFESEARAISTLNHPHICTLHDISHHDGLDVLVMEYVEGDTLADRIARAPNGLKVDEALRYAAQIADALAAAHRRGVVHRDLKPANVMVTQHGVKLLDFGLAMLRPPGLPPADSDPTDPTGERVLRRGTLHYMAPEQLRGGSTDERSDIFALGVMLREMLTGRKPFEADSPAGVIAAILEHQPPPLSTLRSDVPPAIDWAIARCLAKAPEERWQNASDLGEHLKWAGAPRATPEPVGTTRGSRRLALMLASVAIVGVAAVAIGAYLLQRDAQDPVSYRFALPPPDDTTYARLFALSPDGRRLVFTATDRAGVNALWVRSLDGLAGQRVEGSEGAFYPFWSPKGDAIGFFADRKLKVVELATGTVRVLCDAGLGGGGTWSADNTIVFGLESGVAATTGLMRVSAAGGVAEPVTRLTDGSRGIHAWPHFLPDGRHYLYTRIELRRGGGRGGGATGGIYVGELGRNDVRPVLTATRGSEVGDMPLGDAFPTVRAVYADGYLFYVSNGELMAHRFDVERLVVTSEPVRLAENVEQTAPGRSAFAVSPGVVAYRTGRPDSTSSQLAWLDRTGQLLGRIGDPSRYQSAVLSPDGWFILAHGEGRIVRVDVQNGTATPLPFTGGGSPVWSGDGARLAFTGGARLGPVAVSVSAADGSGTAEVIVRPGAQIYPSDWSADGRHIVGTIIRAETGYDLFSMTPGDGTLTYPVASPANESDAQLSPDGQWLAYAVQENAQRWEIYVRPFERAGGLWRISRNGGRHPRWSADGNQLFYATPEGTLMTARLERTPFRVVGLRELFRHEALALDFNVPLSYSPFDPAPDGARFLVRLPATPPMPSPIVVLTNWRAARPDVP